MRRLAIASLRSTTELLDMPLHVETFFGLAIEGGRGCVVSPWLLSRDKFVDKGHETPYIRCVMPKRHQQKTFYFAKSA
jgi:hypothetical protein